MEFISFPAAFQRTFFPRGVCEFAPDGEIVDLEIPTGEKMLLLVMASYADDDGGNIFPLVDSLARKTGQSPRAVHNFRSRLRDRGLIEAVRISGGRTSSEYRITLPNRAQGALFPLEQPGTTSTPTVHQEHPNRAPQALSAPRILMDSVSDSASESKTSLLTSHSAKSASREAAGKCEVQIRVPGGWVLVTKPKHRRLWTGREKTALEGALAEEFIAFFESKGFTAKFSPCDEPLAESPRARRRREIRDEWNAKRSAGEIPKGLGLTDYRQSLLEQEAK